MEVGHSANVSVVLEIFPQPIFLSPVGHGANSQLAVQRNHVPITDVVAVIPLTSFTGPVAEVSVVPGAAADLEIVIARRRVNPFHDRSRIVAPRRRKTPLEEIVVTSRA